MPSRTYTGRDTGRILEPLLQGARERLWVSSPYVGPEYARLLVEKYREGVDVRLITSDSSVNRRAFQVLFTGSRTRLRIIPALLALLGLWSPLLVVWIYEYMNLGDPPGLLVLAAFIIALGVLGPDGVKAALASGVLVGFAAVALLDSESFWGPFINGMVAGGTLYTLVKYLVSEEAPAAPLIPVKVYPARAIVHSKMYIIDGVAVTGSANLTRSGLWRNMETITIHEGPEAEEVASQFLKAWSEGVGDSAAS
ncbi:MAG: phospholipase D-like domain-containing protein [Desulfurococcales archaeon]|nr:phospholipase D-like domain-containing protein [Desulfurococcales archaeon]